MDYRKLEEAVTEHTKVIIPVDIAGVPCDSDRLLQIVEKARSRFRPSNEIQRAIGRIVLLEDAAHAFGASFGGQMTGSLSDFTCFSFHAVKNLTTAEGGAVVWKDIPGIGNDWIYQQYMLLSLHGQSKDALSKNRPGAWEYDIVQTGYKCNMTDIMAAIGRVQMKRYSGILKRRRELIRIYDEGFADLPVETLRHVTETYVSSGHLYLLRIGGYSEMERNRLIEYMAEKGVATNVHYKPLPMHTAYQELGFEMDNYPNAYRQYENEITLPLHTSLSDEQTGYVIETIRKHLFGR